MANYYNINRSIETYELRLIDPNDGQLKSIFDISSIGGGGVQPSDVYTKSEVDTLLSGDLTVSSLQSTNNIQTSSTIRTNTFNVGSLNTKISFYDDTTEYMKYENSTVDATFNGLKVLDNLYTMDIYPQSIKLPYNNKIAFIDTDGTGDDYYNQNYINITIDGGIQRLNHVITSGNEHRFYVGDIATASDGDLVMKLSNTRIDIYKDLYLNDTLFSQGGGSGNPFDENVVINNPYELQCNTFNNNGLNQDVVFNINSNEWLRLQFSDNTVRVPNTKSFLSQEIYFNNIRPLAFTDDVIFYGGNQANNAYTEYFRNNRATETVDFNKVVKCSESLVMTISKEIILDNTSGKKRLIRAREDGAQSVIEISNERSTNNQIRLLNAGSTSMIVDSVNVYTPRQIQGDNGCKVDFLDTRNSGADFIFKRNNIEFFRLDTALDNIVCSKGIVAGGGIKCNTLDSDGDSDVIYKRNNVQFLALDKFIEDTVEKEAIVCSKQLRANSNILVQNLQINQFPVGVEYADFRLENADSIMRFYAGNSTSVNLQIKNTDIYFGRVAICNGGLKSDTIDTNTDTDLSFRRNGIEFFNFLSSVGVDNNDIINVAEGAGISAQNVYGNLFKSRSLGFDTIFYGSNTGATARVEYMRYNYAGESLDFNCPIDNTGLLITGNIVDTTVSDERLKTNIEDVECNFTECVKNVKIKTFEYTDEKYKTNDKYGFIAQQLQENLPKEFKHIVKETKNKKDEGEGYLSINYMKLSVVLWGCCQEQQSKIEHLESRLFELEDIVKEMRGEAKPKAKTKAKPKTKT